MSELKFKVGQVVVNSSGTYAKILQIKNGIHICSSLTDQLTEAENAKSDAVGNFRFNAYSAQVCGIKLAKGGSPKKELTDEEKAKAEKKAQADKDAKAKAEADAQAKAEAEKKAGN